MNAVLVILSLLVEAIATTVVEYRGVSKEVVPVVVVFFFFLLLACSCLMDFTGLLLLAAVRAICVETDDDRTDCTNSTGLNPSSINREWMLLLAVIIQSIHPRRLG